MSHAQRTAPAPATRRPSRVRAPPSNVTSRGSPAPIIPEVHADVGNDICAVLSGLAGDQAANDAVAPAATPEVPTGIRLVRLPGARGGHPRTRPPGHRQRASGPQHEPTQVSGSSWRRATVLTRRLASGTALRRWRAGNGLPARSSGRPRSPSPVPSTKRAASPRRRRRAGRPARRLRGPNRGRCRRPRAQSSSQPGDRRATSRRGRPWQAWRRLAAGACSPCPAKLPLRKTTWCARPMVPPPAASPPRAAESRLAPARPTSMLHAKATAGH